MRSLARDYAAAAESITASWITLIRSGRSATVQRWLRRFPDEALADAPQLGYVGAFVAGLGGGTEAEVDDWLRIAEQVVANAKHPSGRMPDGTTSYDVNVNVIRAAFVYRDVGAAVAIAQRVVAAESRGGQWRVPAFATLAFLRYLSSQADAARAAASEALERSRCAAATARRHSRAHDTEPARGRRRGSREGLSHGPHVRSTSPRPSASQRASRPGSPAPD